MPAQLGRFEILEEIGAGNYGRVYRARIKGAHGFEKIVALKILNTQVEAHNRKEVRALINEARIGGFLKHSGIVDTYEFGEADGRLFIAMEYVDGITLASLLKSLRKSNRYLPLSLVVEIAYSVASSLAYAHERQDDESNEALHLVHRDLKPENIMISKSGEVKILDFGIAVSAANMFRTTLKNMTKGTPAYMSPEQVMGVSDLDARSDLFGLGSVMVETITTDQLFEGYSWTDTMESVLRKDISPVLDTISVVAEDLGTLLGRMLMRDREQRISSAREIARELLQMRVRYPVVITLAETVNAVRSDDWRTFPDSMKVARDWQVPDGGLPPVTGVAPSPDTDLDLSIPNDPTLSELLSRQVDELLAARSSDPVGQRRSPPSHLGSEDSEPRGKTRTSAPAPPELSDRSELSDPGLGTGGFSGVRDDKDSDPRARGPGPTAVSDSTTPDADAGIPPAAPLRTAGRGTVSTMLRQRNTVAVLLVVQTAALVVLTAVLLATLAGRDRGTDPPHSVADALTISLSTVPECTVLVDGKPAAETPLVNFELMRGARSMTLSCPDATIGRREITLPRAGALDYGCLDMNTGASCEL